MDEYDLEDDYDFDDDVYDYPEEESWDDYEEYPDPVEEL